jgi:serine phosphatase RsbU (regulator of sigma subunit)
MLTDEKLAVLKMIEERQITAEQAAGLLDTIEASAEPETTLPDATVEEEAWMLTALLQVTEAISSPEESQDSLDDMLRRVVRVVPLLAGVDTCAISLWDAESRLCAPRACYPASSDRASLGLPASLDQLMSGQPLVSYNHGRHSHAILPMTTQGMFLGVMEVQYERKQHIFTSKETAILANIAYQAAVGVENMRLREEAVQRARLEHEMQMARNVQTSLLPAMAPHVAGWQIASHWRSARSVGGDFYDFIPLGAGRLGLVIADVSDKGMSAALFMALARSIVRASVSRGGSPARGLDRANKLICADAHNGMFVTLVYGVIDPVAGTFSYANAGHTPPILLTTAGLVMLSSHGMALGISETLSLRDERLLVDPDGVVVMYTDGITEAVNAAGEQFGIQRLQGVVSDNRALAPAAIIAQVMQAVAAHAGVVPAFDDATIVVAKRVTEPATE